MLVPSSWDLPPEIKRRFGVKGAGHQRAMVAEGHLLLVLHSLPKANQSDRRPVFFWRKPNGDWRCDQNALGLRSLQKHLDSYGKEQLVLSDRFKSARHADEFFQLLQDIAPVELAAKNLHAALQIAREKIPEDRDIIDLRDWAQDIERSLSLLYLNTKNALDFYIARQAEEQARLSTQSNRIATRLNLLAALFFPLTAIASLFGMNLNSGLETVPIFFWIIFLLGLSIGIWTQRWVNHSYSPKKD